MTGKTFRLVLPGIPRTKKTSNRTFEIGRRCRACYRGLRTVVMPSEAWEVWCKTLAPLIRSALPLRWQPIAYPVNCAALFYRDALRGDSHGFYQGLADVLQHAGLVADDKWIVSWDGSRLLKDTSRPRVELVITATEGDQHVATL
jgi:hypothetical protein